MGDTLAARNAAARNKRLKSVLPIEHRMVTFVDRAPTLEYTAIVVTANSFSRSGS